MITASMLQRALFLDRDGVINVERNYLYCIDDFVFIDGIFSLCEAAVARYALRKARTHGLEGQH